MRRPTIVALRAACALIIGSTGLIDLTAAAEREPGPPLVRQVSDVALPIDAAALERQYVALSAMPSVKVAYSALGPVRLVEGATGIVLSNSTRSLKEGQEVAEVLEKFRDVLLATGTETLKVRANRMSAIRRTIRMDQFIHGIPVLYGGVSVGVDDATGLVVGLNATFLPNRGLPRQPKISEADAAKRVEQLLVERGLAKTGSVETSKASLAYTGTHPDSTRAHLVWAVPARFTPAKDGASDGLFWIDAVDGEYVGSDALSKHLSVYTGNNAAPNHTNYPSGLNLLFDHPGSSGDQIAMNAYNNALDSLQATDAIGGWLQVDPLNVVVHYALNSKDAFYTRKSGIDYLSFAEGITGQSMGPLGNARDVVAHELGHGIARSMFGPFRGEPSDPQSGAIDEAFGDVVAALVDTYKRGGVPDATATWTVAEVYTNNPTKGFRSMSNPKSMDIGSRDWFPARHTGPDEFVAHYNSTIMSHAFKLLANPPSGGFHVRVGQPILDGGVTGTIPSLFVPGLGPAKTWNVFFNTFNDFSIGSFVDMPQLKATAIATTNLLYGAVDADAVDRAFRAVGVGHNCSGPPPAPTMEASDSLCPRWVLSWPAVPGATIYHAQANPASWGWTNALTIVSGDYRECMQQPSSYSHARVRACNGCGCSGWSNTVYFWKWPSCP